MPDAQRLLGELISAALPPLRFLRDADQAQRARARLPVRSWIERLAALRAGEAPRAIRESLDALDGVLLALASAALGQQPELAGRALEILAQLEAGQEGGGADAEMTRVVEAGPPGASAAPQVLPVPPARALTPGQAVARGVDETALAAIELRLGAVAQPTSVVSGVGPGRAGELERFGLATVEDLLYHLPFRYDDRRALCTARQLRAGEAATAILEVRGVDERRVGRGRRAVLTAVAGDATGFVELVWYNQIAYFRSRLKPGTRWIAHGRVERGWGLPLRIVHPELESAEEEDASETAPRVVPVYEKPTAMAASTMRRIAHGAVNAYAGLVPDAVPAPIRARLGLLPLAEALHRVHRPGPDADVAALGAMRSPGHRAIVFDELFFVQLGLLLRKAAVARELGIALAGPGELAGRMIERLPFALTGAQSRVIGEIEADQRAPRPMHRLLQGDVGSGKTVVAVAAALLAIEAGWQAALMAPTELLAEQHWGTVRAVAAGLGVGLWYLTGETASAERREVLPRLAGGEPGLVVGTHALIQEEVRFGRLGLAVIDEQHRFGVLQRAALGRASQGPSPDVLLMTATPIPRTLALSVYGDLDLSYLDELPPGRKPVGTRVFSVAQRPRAYQLVRREVEAGRQAYVVYPLIEESEASELRDATSAADELRREVFPDLRVALVHGRMPVAERDAVMRAFKAGEHQVLVATTVIEVGIDVPNASVMVVEHAERFGLAQLHQLRGRVGRGSDAAYCLLIADWAQSKEARERLKVMTETHDGLRIAESDLAIRGPGALLGTRQAGLPDFRVANLLRDAAILREARAAAEEVLAADPTLSSPESAALARVLQARWAGRLGLARVG